METVSVIVPLYGVEAYVEECLASITAQTYPALDILCVNDATADNSAGLARAMGCRDGRIRVLHHAVNRGLGAARNTGLRHARGAFVKFVDSDDRLPPDAVERLVAALETTGADFSFSALEIFDGRYLHQRSPFHSLEGERAGASGLIDFAADPWLLNEMWPSAWLGLWRADRIRDGELAFPEGTAFEDHEFFFRYGFAGRRGAYVPVPLYWYRHGRPGQITRDPAQVFDVFPVAERLQALFRARLSGEVLDRVAARSAVRLLHERTWALDPDAAGTREFLARAAAFLARFPEGLLRAAKDHFVSDADLARLLGPPPSPAGPDGPA